MKRIMALLMAAILAAILIGCGQPKEPLMYSGRMKYAGKSIDHGIQGGYMWIDTETGVCYLESNTGVFTVMVDREGKPFIANGWRDWGVDDE